MNAGGGGWLGSKHRIGESVEEKSMHTYMGYVRRVMLEVLIGGVDVGGIELPLGPHCQT